MLIFLALSRLRQTDHEFKISLEYIGKSCLSTTKTKTETNKQTKTVI